MVSVNQFNNSRLTHLIFILLLGIILISCKGKKRRALTIAAASNMSWTLEEMVREFEAKTKIKTKLVIGSSGSLANEIKEGASYDIFLSANLKYPEELYEEGLTLYPPEIYATGQIVLWTLNERIRLSERPIRSNKIKGLIIANPETAPYGIAAVEALKFYDSYDKIKDKIIYAESIAEVNALVLSDSSNLGITSKSSVLSDKLKNKGKWIPLPKKAYKPIDQGIVILKKDREMQKNSEKFYQFLFSRSGREILENNGYSTFKD